VLVSGLKNVKVLIGRKMEYKTQKSVIKLNTTKIDHMFYWKCKNTQIEMASAVGTEKSVHL